MENKTSSILSVISASMKTFVEEHANLTEPICRALCIYKRMDPDGGVSGHSVFEDGESVKQHVSSWPPLWFTFDEEIRLIIAAFIEVAKENKLIDSEIFDKLEKEFKLKKYVAHDKDGKVLKTIESYNEFFKDLIKRTSDIIPDIGKQKLVKNPNGFLEMEGDKKEREWFDSHKRT